MQRILQAYIRPMRLSQSSPAMLREQFTTLTRLVPFLYSICIITAISLTLVFSLVPDAPIWLSKGVPCVLVAVMLLRRQNPHSPSKSLISLS